MSKVTKVRSEKTVGSENVFRYLYLYSDIEKTYIIAYWVKVSSGAQEIKGIEA